MATATERLTASASERGWSDHLVDWCDVREMTTFCDAVSVVAQHCQSLPLSHKHQHVAKSISDTAGDAWGVLAFPAMISEGTKFCHSISQLTTNPDDEPIRELASKAFFQGNDFVYQVSKGTSFMHAKKWVDLGKSGAAWSSGINYLAWFIGDAHGIHDQVVELNALTAGEKADDEEGHKRWLCIAKLVMHVASALIAFIGLTVLVFEIVVESVALLPALTLGLATFYLVFKIYAHFYERVHSLDDL